MNLDLRERIFGCWAGKCLGGAIGMPFEGVPCRPNLTPESIRLRQDVPNDDLEMQLIWLVGLKEFGLGLDAAAFGDLWRRYIPAGCDEYSIAIRNLRHGANPPVTGWLDNCFADGMGATIRSEIWSAVFAGHPNAACHFAELDASVDHWGDGVWGEIFMAAVECHAFSTGELVSSLEFGRAQLPDDCRLARTLDVVFELFRAGVDAAEAGNRIREQFYSFNFTDCVMNLAFICYGLLWGRGEFLPSVLLAVNLGRDADCTGASVGAFLGILLGRGGLPAELLERLNDQLSLSPYVQRVPGVPRTLTETVEETLRLHERLCPMLPEKDYPAYAPYRPDGSEPAICRSRWLVVDPAECDIEALESELRGTGRCPESLRNRIIETGQLQFDLSSFARDANTLELFTFLEVNGTPPELVMISVTADVGLTMWFDGEMQCNHHSRMPALPSFHRAEGGAAFTRRFLPGERRLVRIRLQYCLPPLLRICLMFGDLANNHLDEITLKI